MALAPTDRLKYPVATLKPGRIHRLLKLILLLQTGRSYLADDLAKEIRVSRRTLFRDLDMLKLAGIPLLYSKKQHSYGLEKNFFLPPINFTFSEVLSLMLIVQKYASRTALPNLELAATAMAKIESTLPREIRDYCGHALDAVAFRPPPLSDAGGVAETFNLLWRATLKKLAVDLTYDSYYERAEIQTELRPYHLTFMARGWYVIGYSSLHGEVRTFKLERVVRAVLTGASFEPDPAFNPADYFGNAWQMIRGNKRYHVAIRFSPKVAGNVEEVLWHPTQQCTPLDDGGLRFDAEVDGVDEIAWWVLGYGKEAVVEKPAVLRKILADHARAMSEQYAEA